jgi:hypothetical protein
MTAGSVRSAPDSVTSISPETPVASWRTFTSSSAWRSRGTSSRTSEITSVCVSAAHPSTATASPIIRTRRGRTSATSTPRRPHAASLSRTRPIRSPKPLVAIASHRPAAFARSRGSMGGTSGRRSEKRISAAKPAVSAHSRATRIPITRSTPNPRTIGTGESKRTRKPTAVDRPAVAIVGPPALAAAEALAAAPGGTAAVRSTSSNRAWNWMQ